VSARRGLALAFAAGVWIVAIVLLWRTRVPSGLDVSGVDVHRYFNDAELRRSDRYGRVGLLLFLASQLTLVLVLAGYARWGVRLTRESAAGRIGTGMMLGMLGLAFVWLAEPGGPGRGRGFAPGARRGAAPRVGARARSASA